ncbi:peptidase M23 [Streptantibioticus ferralitis]|uniref:Peptidase M23 n=1 Tax=Streptantibioticus ferralitis TaxID=236510 RepID=A0ABT5Z3W1_9ACTN|nr:peptidase M23 [Streptantibioticus ferralitis]MDF2258521.1 peptidase M23 [Streptantibioticus ferralitis]
MEGREFVAAAAGVASRAVGMKVAAAAAALFLIFLILVGLVGGVGSGAALGADSGTCGGQPQGDGNGNGSTVVSGGDPTQDEISNAKVIDGVAADRKLPGRATLIALMTALQESGLHNIDYGDRDSIGLFQQRPSAGWGSKDQIMDPKYSANAFFGGRGANWPPGLVDIKNWLTMPLGDAAQAVQVSAFPDLYATREGEARQVAQKAGIDLNRDGSAQGSTSGGGDTSGGTTHDGGQCQTGGDSGTPGKPGEPFHDGNSPWPAQVKNPRSSQDAISWAKQQVNGSGDWYDKCLAFTAIAYGWSFSGTNYAKDLYLVDMPQSMRHDGDRNPPPGALMFWDTGERAGHVAIYVGNGMIASNDILRPGYIDVVPATEIESKWGATYLGWAPPYYPHAG